MLTYQAHEHPCEVAGLGECDAFLRGFAFANVVWLVVLWCLARRLFRRPR